MASILIVSGPNEGDYHPLRGSTIEVGRDEGCTIQIADDRVSRRHLRIRFDDRDRSYHAVDEKSANGTLHNDRRITADTRLADGDILAIGRTELMFSELDFTDDETAFKHYRKKGERGKSTIIGPQ